jgi:serine/threonine protein kinase
MKQELTETERERIDSGYHEEAAASLRERGRHDLAGWVLEQIWDWDGALDAYREAGQPIDALRIAIESGSASHMDLALGDIEDDARRDVVDEAIELLKSRRRPMEAARLLALRDDPTARAEALLRAGDRLGAARIYAEAQLAKEGLDILLEGGLPTAGPALTLAAQLAWDLGDAEGAARMAQKGLRAGADDEETYALLSRALTALGHDLAAQMVVQVHPTAAGRDGDDTGVPGRYRVLGLGPSGLVGAAYLGMDRVTMQEVELHLLLAELHDAGPVDTEIMDAMDRFAATAVAASEIGHPAIRPILRLDATAGLLVMPRAEGQTLRAMIREPGMRSLPSRARGLIAFLLEGLQAAHARGLVHGWLLPSQIPSDAAGRPLLGPFGAHHLAGLAATRTGSLEEIMAVTAPEVREGGPPTVQSDLYAVGALLLALLEGRLTGFDEEAPMTPEVEAARALMAPNPEDRPRLEDVLAMLRQPVADIRELEVGVESDAGRRGRDPQHSDVVVGLAVEASESWNDELLDALCRANAPWLQPILDRQERQLVLAPWPAGCRGLGGDGPDWRELLPPEALDLEDEAVLHAIETRMAPSSLVRTPSGDWMVALDDLLTR